MEDFVHHEMK